jgi:uncharacterized membrane protein YgcG
MEAPFVQSVQYPTLRLIEKARMLKHCEHLRLVCAYFSGKLGCLLWFMFGVCKFVKTLMLKKTLVELTFNNMQKRKLVASHGGVKRARPCLERRNTERPFLRGGEFKVVYYLNDNGNPFEVDKASAKLKHFVDLVNRILDEQKGGGGGGGGGEEGGGAGGGEGGGGGGGATEQCESYSNFRKLWSLPKYVSSCYRIAISEENITVGPYLGQTKAQVLNAGQLGRVIEMSHDVKIELTELFTNLANTQLKHARVCMNIMKYLDKEDIIYEPFLDDARIARDINDDDVLSSLLKDMGPPLTLGTVNNSSVNTIDLHVTSAIMSSLFVERPNFENILEAVTHGDRTLDLKDVLCEVRYADTECLAKNLDNMCLTPDIHAIIEDDVKQFKTCEGLDLKDLKWWNGDFFNDLVDSDIQKQGDNRLGGQANTVVDLKKRLVKLAKCWGICIFWIYPSGTNYDYDVLNQQAFTMCILYTHRGHYSVGESRWVVLNVIPYYESKDKVNTFCDDHSLVQLGTKLYNRALHGDGETKLTCSSIDYHFDDFKDTSATSNALRTSLQKFYHDEFNSFDSLQTIYTTFNQRDEGGHGGGGGGHGGGGGGHGGGGGGP